MGAAAAPFFSEACLTAARASDVCWAMRADANASAFKVQAAYQCSVVLRDLIRPYLLRRTKADVQLGLPAKSTFGMYSANSARFQIISLGMMSQVMNRLISPIALIA